MTDIAPASQRVIDAAAALGLTLEIHRFPEGTRTAADAAAAIGCHLGAIAKSIVLAADGKPVLVLTSGANRVDVDKVAAALGVENVGKADAAAAREATGYAIGGTAPFGHPQAVPMLFDEDLLNYDVVWAAGGTPDTVFPITPADLLRTTGAVIADVREGTSGS
jgi:prolyl-tRNA editing enzyme YbaK/EbsC (Cys-tRNA(Pro) deacylase)